MPRKPSRQTRTDELVVLLDELVELVEEVVGTVEVLATCCSLVVGEGTVVVPICASIISAHPTFEREKAAQSWSHRRSSRQLCLSRSS